MSDLGAIIVRVVAFVLQLAGVAYASLIAWLMSVWMVDDSWAVHASDADWWVAAGKRVALGLIGAAIVGGVLFVFNRALVHWKLASPTARPLRAALLGTTVVAIASIAGAVIFVVERPFM
jgi:hypothetical protein